MNLNLNDVSNIEVSQEVCHDSTHCHPSPVVRKMQMDYAGKHVEIVNDGRYHARVDGGIAGIGLSLESVGEFLKKALKL